MENANSRATIAANFHFIDRPLGNVANAMAPISHPANRINAVRGAMLNFYSPTNSSGAPLSTLSVPNVCCIFLCPIQLGWLWCRVPHWLTAQPWCVGSALGLVNRRFEPVSANRSLRFPGNRILRAEIKASKQRLDSETPYTETKRARASPPVLRGSAGSTSRMRSRITANSNRSLRTAVSVSGKWNFTGRDKGAETAPRFRNAVAAGYCSRVE
jgi:hypothetical protein